jgi:outer membrane protein assembly factor BamD
MNIKLLYFFLIFALVHCSTTDKKDSETPEAIFAKAQELEKEDRLEEAIKKYNDVKNKFPYSKLASQAELAIADTYFKQESFPEAQASYVTFRELHPKHPQIAYVIYRIGLSVFNQLPETIDRDLSLANQAITIFEEVIKNYSTSEYIPGAQKKKDICLKMLAEKEVYIANFYFKKGHYETANKRYLESFNKHGIIGFNTESLEFAIASADKVGATQSKDIFTTKLHEKKTEAQENPK